MCEFKATQNKKCHYHHHNQYFALDAEWNSKLFKSSPNGSFEILFLTKLNLKYIYLQHRLILY